MARKIESRLKISGTLLAESPLHVGGRGGDPLVDLALAVNGQGKYYISGTSLSGALKGWMQECFNDGLISKQIWGFSEKEEGEDSNQGHASFVIVEDAIINLLKGTNIEIRDGVGIDREWGTAAEQIKYDRAIIPRGASFNLNLTFDIPKAVNGTNNIDSGQLISAVETLLATLEEGEIRLGAAKTRGLGKIKLKPGYTVKKCNFSTPTGILAALRGKEEIHEFKATSLTIPKLTVKIAWKPLGALMVKAAEDGIAVDIVPLVSSVNQEVALVLPGSSIKGALRTQAERIIRTVCQIPMTQETEAKKRFLKQLQNISLIETIFGTATKHESSPNEQRKPGLGSLSVDDCYVNKDSRMSYEEWREIISAPKMTDDDWRKLESVPIEDRKTHLRKALDKAKLTTTQQAYHVAVDRWTGGAADGFLYSNLEPFNIAWEDIYLTLNFKRIPEHEQNAAIALLLLILRDLYQGRIPLGYGVNRGMGAIAIKNISFSGKSLPSCFQSLSNNEISFTAAGNFSGLDPNLLSTLEQSWKDWIESNHYQVEVIA